MKNTAVVLAGGAMLVVLLAFAAAVAETEKSWEVDSTASIFNSHDANAKSLAHPKTKTVAVNGKNAIFPFATPNEKIADAIKTQQFKQAVSSPNPVEGVQANGVRAVVTNYSGARLQALEQSDEVDSFLKGETQSVPPTYPRGVDDAKIFNASAGNETTPVLAPYAMSNETFQAMNGSPEFQQAVAATRDTSGKKLFTYQDEASGESVLIPNGFSEDEVEALQGSSAVKSSLSGVKTRPGVPVDVETTREWMGVRPETLPKNPGRDIDAPFDPFSGLSLPGYWWILPVATAAIPALLYFWMGRLDTRHKKVKKEKAAHVTELEVGGGVGVSFKKADGESRKTMSLSPLFELKLIDNILMDDEDNVTVSLENVCGERIEGIKVYSGMEETHVGVVEAGEEKAVSFKPSVSAEGLATVLIQFTPLIVGGRVYNKFEVEIPVEKI